MIEKLDTDELGVGRDDPTVAKINELVDAANAVTATQEDPASEPV